MIARNPLCRRRRREGGPAVAEGEGCWRDQRSPNQGRLRGHGVRLAILAAIGLAACAPAAQPGDPAAPDGAPTSSAEEAPAPGHAADLPPHPDDAPLTEAQLRTYPDARDMPADVQRFIVLWQDCAHWLGEPPYDADRARRIEQAVAALCPGIDGVGRAVRARHAGNAEVLARLIPYEPLGQ